jgi:hypothetical protein
MKHITNNLKNTMQQIIENEISNKCIVEGYIKPNSIVILSHSNGIQENQNIKFQVVFECLVCNPSEGQFINCVAKNITKAGIRAEVEEADNPLIIFVARDHNYLNKLFSNVKVDQKIVIRVIGSRFELHDSKISVIGEIIKSSRMSKLSTLNVGNVLENPDIEVEQYDGAQKIDLEADEEEEEEEEEEDEEDDVDTDDVDADEVDADAVNADDGVVDKNDDEEIGEVDNKSVNESDDEAVNESDDEDDVLSSNNGDDSAETAEDVTADDDVDVVKSDLNK